MAGDSPTADTTDLTEGGTRPLASRLPKWMTSFGVQIVAGLVVGLAFGFIARAIEPAEPEETSWLGGLLDEVG